MPSKQMLAAQQVYDSTLKMFEEDFQSGDTSELLQKLAGDVPMIFDAVSPATEDKSGLVARKRAEERSDVEGRVRQCLSWKLLDEKKTSASKRAVDIENGLLLLAQADSRDFVKYCCITSTSVVNQPCFVLSDGFYISEAGINELMSQLDEANDNNEEEIFKGAIQRNSESTSKQRELTYAIQITDRDILRLRLHIQQVRENNILRKSTLDVIQILLLGLAASCIAPPLGFVALAVCMMGIGKVNDNIKEKLAPIKIKKETLENQIGPVLVFKNKRLPSSLKQLLNEENAPEPVWCRLFNAISVRVSQAAPQARRLSIATP